MSYYQPGIVYTDSETGYEFRFDIVPDEVPESFAQRFDTPVFILQAHKDSDPEDMLRRLRKEWAMGRQPMPQDSDKHLTLEEHCRKYGFDYAGVQRQIAKTNELGRTLTPEEVAECYEDKEEKHYGL